MTENEASAGVEVVITGGGTAGHTNPGIAIAQALVARGLKSEQIRFVGGQRGNEGTIVPEAGFEIDLLPGRGIQRSLAPAAIKENLSSIVALVRGFSQAIRLIRRLRPSVVLCLGGYAAAGASFAAVLWRVPIVVSEQNARASAVNRIVGRFAKVCALPYPDTDLPKGVLTGNPIRSEIISAVEAKTKHDARIELGLPGDRFVLAVWSGSLGATRINTATRELAELWADRSDIAIHHVVGRRDWEKFKDVSALDSAAIHYQVVEYETRMPAVLVAADLALTRAGASTTGELAAAGLPALAVPLPHSPRDHQRANAAELQQAGGAVVLEDGDITAPYLATLVDEVAQHESEQLKRSRAARSVGRPNAAGAVAAIIIDQGHISVPATPKHD